MSRLTSFFGWLRRAAKLAGLLVMAIVVITLVAALWGRARTAVDRPPPPPIVNDVSQLNPIRVAEVIAPTTTQEIVEAVRHHPGPISVGGGRYSMGGQTATEGGLQIDMRQFNRILEFSSEHRTITVQTGVRWRQIQEHIDSANLSVKIMQTYANFTVGGSLSVNVHGRYVGQGPLILSVRSLKVVLADGSLVEVSPSQHPEIFYGVIGGYGGLGVITEATLDLAPNIRVKRHDRTMPITEYRRWFFENVRHSPSAVFHNADIYPNAYVTVNATTFEETQDSVTVPQRLQPTDRGYKLNRFLFWMISEWPWGKGFRQHVIDPILFRGEPVLWRNYEASYDVAELEPSSRAASTYVLQEYFVPVERFDEFIPRMREVLRRRKVNVINVSIRHAHPDPGSLLAWAQTEVFAFVLYYKQDTDLPSREAVGVWTRELIDAALSVGGSYYLPYQPQATEQQFRRAFPRADEYFALKRRLDPTTKFRNTLWDKYYLPRVDRLAPGLSPEVHERLASRTGYRRDGGQTYLTHPEWYIVYSSDEYASFLKDHLPTEFPYVASIGQYWANYREARALTRHRYPFNWGYHVMLWVIGSSYSAELALKGLYENTVGRFAGWTAGHEPSDEDRYAYEVADDYGRFIHVRPWYEYRFARRLHDLWTELPMWGPHLFRKWERKLFLSLEYGVKAAYAALITAATHAAYTPEEERMQLVVAGWTDELTGRDSRIKVVERLDSVHTLLATPRYDEFRDVLLDLARTAAPLRIVEVAGNEEILLTGVAPSDWTFPGDHGELVYSLPLPTDSTRKRIAIRMPTPALLDFLRVLQTEGRATVDHIYDY